MELYIDTEFTQHIIEYRGSSQLYLWEGEREGMWCTVLNLAAAKRRVAPRLNFNRGGSWTRRTFRFEQITHRAATCGIFGHRRAIVLSIWPCYQICICTRDVWVVA